MNLAGQILAAVMGTIGFSVMFSVPREYYPLCGLVGGVGWLVYCLTLPQTSPEGATLAGTVLVVLLSRLCAVRRKCPVTLFLIPGIIPLVPGGGVYWTAYYIVTEQMDRAAQTGFEAVKIAVAIVLGIVFVFQVPQKVFRIGTKNRTAGDGKQGPKKS